MSNFIVTAAINELKKLPALKDAETLFTKAEPIIQKLLANIDWSLVMSDLSKYTKNPAALTEIVAELKVLKTDFMTLEKEVKSL